jgi:hypothetical protein
MKSIFATCVTIALAMSSPLFAQAPSTPAATVFSARGVRLPGTQLQYNAVFDLLDFNGDGKLDLFMPTGSMMMFNAQLNVGTKSQPAFGHAVTYPLNITEDVPQTVEHNMAQAICDLNGDGLWDMIFFDGQLRYAPNTGTPHGPNHWNLYKEIAPGEKQSQFFPGSAAMIKENARYATGPETMYWTRGIFGRQVLTLTAADWDGDGLQDLLISRFKSEAPGVQALGGRDTWSVWGRRNEPAKMPALETESADFSGPLQEVPARGLYFYKNVGTKDKPWFDKGVEILTPDGKSIAAPNPVVFDCDGDGVLDVLSCEASYRCNAFRVDWPTAPNVMWFRRAKAEDVAQLQPRVPLLDAVGKPIPSGTMARVGDMNGDGTPDLVVMDGALKGSVRWYPNAAKSGKPTFAAAQVLAGQDFLDFDFIAGAQVVNWFGPHSRDLVVYGTAEQHCKFAWRRTALYKNVATKPGEIKYEFVGWLSYNGDEALVPVKFEQSMYDAYGSSVAVSPFEAGAKQLMVSVGGRLYRFSDLASDGLTFRKMTPLDLHANQNLNRGWQELPVDFAEPVKYIRLTNDRNGMGNFRDSMLHIVNFEALAGDKNVATLENVQEVRTKNQTENYWSKARRVEKMFTPGNAPSDTQPNFTSFGYAHGPTTITLKEPAKLDKIRFLLSEYEEASFRFYWPFYWQGRLYRQTMEKGQPWYQYLLEVSADGVKWTTVANRMANDMNRAHPLLLDWDGDGKMDLVLGVQSSNGIYPAWKEYRLYRNTGTNAAPIYDKYQLFCDDKGKPLHVRANWTLSYTEQCGLSVQDMDGDGKPDLFIEGDSAGQVVFYKNVSTDAAHELKFAKAAMPRENGGAFGAGDRHYFDVGDVDGDGIPDFLQSSWANFYFHKGIASTAPARVNGIGVVKTSKADATLQWKRPAGATSYEIRWNRGELTDLTWPDSTGASGTYDAKEGELQTAVLSGLPSGEEINVAVKSLNAKREYSSLSQSAPVATAPLSTLVLRNGPQDGASTPAYEGTEATTLDGTKPDAATKPGVLTAKAVSAGKYQMVALRFKDLPKVNGLQRAVLELATGGGDAFTLPISCNVIDNDWDAATATKNAPAPGKAWGKNELVGGGEFLSNAQTEFTREPRRTLHWDVTAAIRDAQAANRNEISLLIRVDYTGKYINGSGYSFSGVDDPNVELRPRLRIVSRS